MSFKAKITAAAAVGVVAGGMALAGPSAFASTPDCAFSNGCATLHGFDGAGHPVAMDAKYQKKTEILIGYPDNVGDTATSFDGVLHFTKGPKVTTTQDTALLVQQRTNDAFVHRYTLGCIGLKGDTKNTLVFSGDPASGHTATWSMTGSPEADITIDPNTGQITDNGSPDTLSGDATVTVSDGYGDIANAVVTITDTAGSLSVNVDSGNCVSVNFPPAEQSGGVQFAATDHSFPTLEGYTWSASGFPAGVSIDPVTGFIAPGTANPGNYGVKITATDKSGAASTITFTLVVDAQVTTTPGPHVPYYTFVFAPHGTWSNMCVTDVNGSGALKLETCTLGKDKYQDFFALDGSGNPQQIVDGSTKYHFQDWLANVANPGHSCLIDRSTLDPGTPQSDVTDEGVNGRQLRVDGDCTASATLWNWNT